MITRNLIKGKTGFRYFAPWYPSLIKFKLAKYIFTSLMISRKVRNVYKGNTTISYECGVFIGGLINNGICRYPSYCINIPRSNIHKHSIRTYYRGLGAVHRTWIGSPDANGRGRVIKRMSIVYHDAFKAGKHIDVHLGHLSLVMRISGKPVESLLKFNSKGVLTDDSKKLLIEHVKGEIANNSRVAQNHDHTRSNATCTWFDGHDSTGYGSGITRQVILEENIEVYKYSKQSSDVLHFYIPSLNSNRGIYLYRLINPEKGTPICIIGNEKPKVPEFNDRLHLKMINPNEVDKFIEKVNPNTITRKYDGASAYFNKDGDIARYYSPRLSKETGERIEYTFKTPEIINFKGKESWHSDIDFPNKAQGMGELLFWKPTLIGKVTEFIGFRGPEVICWNYISSASIGGILNGHKIRDGNIFPEYRLYRVDKWNSEEVLSTSFFQNRKLQMGLASISSRLVKVVDLVTFKEKTLWEGVVGVHNNEPVTNGYKLKWHADEEDWIAVEHELYISPKGNIAGVMLFKNPEGKLMRLGPGQLGSFDDNMAIIDNPNNYIDRCAKVVSRRGHSGRAAKLLMWHLDK